MLNGKALKTLREKHGMSQRELADKLGVNIGRVIGWETTGGIAKKYLSAIQNIFPKDNVNNQKEEDKTWFPFFLFEKKDQEFLKNLVLSKDEQELIGLKILYMDPYSESWDPNDNNGLKKLPYAFVERHGAWQTINMYKSINRKFCYPEVREFVVSALLRNPNQEFDIRTADADFIYQIFNWLQIYVDTYSRRDITFLMRVWDTPYSTVWKTLQRIVYGLENTEKWKTLTEDECQSYQESCLPETYQHIIQKQEDGSYIYHKDAWKLLEWYEKRFDKNGKPKR